MNKQELIDAVASEVGIAESAVAETIAAFLAEVSNAVALRGENHSIQFSALRHHGAEHGRAFWASNYPCPRGITHNAQVVRRLQDDAPFVSESFVSSVSPVISLKPLEK